VLGTNLAADGGECLPPVANFAGGKLGLQVQVFT
jgi:hypothetical protein